MKLIFFIPILLFITPLNAIPCHNSELGSAIERSSSYKFIVNYLGKETSCKYLPDDKIQELIYLFPKDGKIEATFNSEIEYGYFGMTVPNISFTIAMILLKNESLAYFGGQDCGIDWYKYKIENYSNGSFDRVWEGDVCNCKARMHYENNILNGIIFHAVC